MPVEEDEQRCVEHVRALGGALGAAVETGEIVANGGIGAFDEMRLRLGLDMRFAHAVAFEGDTVAGVGVGVDGADVGPYGLDQMVEGYGAVDPFVADVIRNNATFSPRISSPYEGALPFFWM